MECNHNFSFSFMQPGFLYLWQMNVPYFQILVTALRFFLGDEEKEKDDDDDEDEDKQSFAVRLFALENCKFLYFVFKNCCEAFSWRHAEATKLIKAFFLDSLVYKPR